MRASKAAVSGDFWFLNLVRVLGAQVMELSQLPPGQLLGLSLAIESDGERIQVNRLTGH